MCNANTNESHYVMYFWFHTSTYHQIQKCSVTEGIYISQKVNCARIENAMHASSLHFSISQVNSSQGRRPCSVLEGERSRVRGIT